MLVKAVEKMKHKSYSKEVNEIVLLMLIVNFTFCFYVNFLLQCKNAHPSRNHLWYINVYHIIMYMLFSNDAPQNYIFFFPTTEIVYSKASHITQRRSLGNETVLYSNGNKTVIQNL